MCYSLSHYNGFASASLCTCSSNQCNAQQNNLFNRPLKGDDDEDDDDDNDNGGDDGGGDDGGGGNDGGDDDDHNEGTMIFSSRTFVASNIVRWLLLCMCALAVF